MAGIGDSWGTREELLHPRDSHGQFRTKWKMSEAVREAALKITENFRPRTFATDSQATQYVQNLGHRKPGRFQGGRGYARLQADLDNANADLVDGMVDDPSTKKFIKMMDDSMIDAPEPFIASAVVGPEAFGLTPESLPQLEDMTGDVLANRGYTPVNLGTAVGGGQGKITIRMAVPAGTKVAVPGRDPNDRAVYIDRDQEYTITKVKPDGQGGYFVSVVATPPTEGENPVSAGGRSGAGPGLDREAAVKALEDVKMKRDMGEQGASQLPGGAAAGGLPEDAQGRVIPQGAAPPGGAPAADPATERAQRRAAIIGRPAPTQEQGGQTQAPAPAAQPEVPPAPEAVNVPQPGVEAPSAAPVPDGGATSTATGAPAASFRDALDAAGLESPSKANRKDFNDAIAAVESGKRKPADVVRDLDSDIAALRRNKGKEGVDQEENDRDLEQMEKLADLTREHFKVGEPTEFQRYQQKLEREANPQATKESKAPAAPGKPTEFQKDQARREREANPQVPKERKKEPVSRVQSEVQADLARREKLANPSVPKKAAKKKTAPGLTGPEQFAKDLDDDALNAKQREDWAAELGPEPKEMKSATGDILLDEIADLLRNGRITRPKAAARLRDQAREDDTADADYLRKLADHIEADTSKPNKRVPLKPKREANVDEAEASLAGRTERNILTGLNGLDVTNLRGLADKWSIETRGEDKKLKLKAVLAKELAAHWKATPSLQKKATTPEGEELPEPDELDGLLLKQLQERAKEAGIKLNSKMRKAEILAELKQRRDNPEPEVEADVPDLAPEDLRVYEKLRKQGVDREEAIDVATGLPAEQKKAVKAAARKAAPKKAKKPTEAELVDFLDNLPPPPSGPEAGEILRNRPALTEDDLRGMLQGNTLRQLREMAGPDGRNLGLSPKASKKELIDALAPLDAADSAAAREARLATPAAAAPSTPLETLAEAPEVPEFVRKAAKKAAVKAAVAKPSSDEVKARLQEIGDSGSLEDAQAYIDDMKLSAKDLRQLIQDVDGGSYIGSKDTKQQMRDKFLNVHVVGRQNTRAVRNAMQRDRVDVPELAPPAATPEADLPDIAPLTPESILARLDEFDNPVSREQAAEMLAGLNRQQLMTMARAKSIPNAGKLKMADLRQEIVNATTGRRLDSIATRGFTGLRPDSDDLPQGSTPDDGVPEAARRAGIDATELARMQARAREVLAEMQGIPRNDTDPFDDLEAHLPDTADGKLTAKRIRELKAELEKTEGPPGVDIDKRVAAWIFAKMPPDIRQEALDAMPEKDRKEFLDAVRKIDDQVTRVQSGGPNLARIMSGAGHKVPRAGTAERVDYETVKKLLDSNKVSEAKTHLQRAVDASDRNLESLRAAKSQPNVSQTSHNYLDKEITKELARQAWARETLAVLSTSTDPSLQPKKAATKAVQQAKEALSEEDRKSFEAITPDILRDTARRAGIIVPEGATDIKTMYQEILREGLRRHLAGEPITVETPDVPDLRPEPTVPKASTNIKGDTVEGHPYREALRRLESGDLTPQQASKEMWETARHYDGESKRDNVALSPEAQAAARERNLDLVRQYDEASAEFKKRKRVPKPAVVEEVLQDAIVRMGGKDDIVSAAEGMKNAETPEAAAAAISGLSANGLRDLAARLGVIVGSGDNKTKLRQRILFHGRQRQLDSDAVSRPAPSIMDNPDAPTIESTLKRAAKSTSPEVTDAKARVKEAEEAFQRAERDAGFGDDESAADRADGLRAEVEQAELDLEAAQAKAAKKAAPTASGRRRAPEGSPLTPAPVMNAPGSAPGGRFQMPDNAPAAVPTTPVPAPAPGRGGPGKRTDKGNSAWAAAYQNSGPAVTLGPIAALDDDDWASLNELDRDQIRGGLERVVRAGNASAGDKSRARQLLARIGYSEARSTVSREEATADGRRAAELDRARNAATAAPKKAAPSVKAQVETRMDVAKATKAAAKKVAPAADREGLPHFTESELQGMGPARLKDIEDELGITRPSLDRAERVAHILANMGPPPKADGGGRSDAAAEYSSRQQNLKALMDGKDLAMEPQILQAGVMKETYKNGTQAIRKDSAQHDPLGSQEQKKVLHAELLVPEVYRELGLRTAAATDLGDGKFGMEYVENARTGREVFFDYDRFATVVPDKIKNSREGILMALGDYLTAQGDRHAGNWMWTDDGHIVPIDNESAFGPSLRTDFDGIVTGLDGKSLPNVPISPEDLAEIMTRLRALEPRFKELGRQDWWKRMMQRAEVLVPNAKGTERWYS